MPCGPDAQPAACVPSVSSAIAIGPQRGPPSLPPLTDCCSCHRPPYPPHSPYPHRHRVAAQFRESLDLAKQRFTAAVGSRKLRGSAEEVDTVTRLVEATLASYGNVGIYDPSKLAEIDFLNKPELLLELVSGSRHRESRAQKPEMLLLTEITMQWMQMNVERRYPPLTPHHTQAFTVLMMYKFFREHLADAGKAATGKGKAKRAQYKAFIAQLATGEGKSIVIAMLAIFMVKLCGVRVHVLENNEGLLQRDYAQNAPFYERFKISSGTNLDDKDTQIVYCLKDAINRRFLRAMVAGKLDEELGQAVLIVDEVDDLIVNERPNAHYVKKDAQQTPALQKCFAALKAVKAEDIDDDLHLKAPRPEGVDDDVWMYSCQVAWFTHHKRVENQHYRVIESDTGRRQVLMLDDSGNVPKVRLTAPWLQWIDYKLCGNEPFKETRHACVCTPYIFNKYTGIFGLTGSVGGKAELQYLAKTYKALKFDVPRFLDTCHGDARKAVVNHGVELLPSAAAQIQRVCELAGQYYRKVPVLIITTGAAQIKQVLAELREGVGAKVGIPADEVQRLSQFDEKNRSLRKDWQRIIEDATRRLGGASDSRCRVTVTDKFGGRGHDFQVVDKESNANGGMLVIATSIPDEREWIQWKGRTARQDRPGQYFVILDEKSEPFSLPKHKKLASKFQALASAPAGRSREAEALSPQMAMEELLLSVSDEGIGEKLKNFEGEQV